MSSGIVIHTHHQITPVNNALDPLVWQPIFLTYYRQTLNIGKACKIAGVSRPTVIKYLKIDAEFAQAFNDAKAEAIDDLEESAYERATKGSVIQRTNYDKDGNVRSETTEPRFETQLTIKMLEANRPEIYNPDKNINVKIEDNTTYIKASLVQAVQALIDSGESYDNALNYLSLRGVAQEHIALISTEDITLPEVIEVTPEAGSEE